jgi:hypothetical protein
VLERSRRQPLHGNQGQVERVDLGEHAKQRGLIDKRPANNRLAAGMVMDRQPVESIGPAIRQVTFHPNRVLESGVHCLIGLS